MASHDHISILALKYICGEKQRLCRLCFSSEEVSIPLESTLKIQKSYCNDSVSFCTVLHNLGVPNEPHLPRLLCSNCATILKNSYIFQKLAEFSNKKWKTIFRILDDTLSQSSSLNLQMRSACAIINSTENFIFTSQQKCTTNTKLEAVSKVNKMIQRYKSKLTSNKSKFVCEECGKIFKAKFLLTKHKIIHNKSKYPCPDCPKIFRLPTYLEVHAERVHYAKLLQCSKCPKKFSTKRVLKHHTITEHVPASCNECKIDFPSKTALRFHLNHHKVNTCPYCNKRYTSIKYFRLHKKYCGKVGNPQTYICDICEKVYQAKHGLKSHLRTEHGFGEVISCSWCNKKYDAISRLNDHIVKHTKEKNFHCDKCGRKFVSHKSLTNHIRLHTGERPYSCNLCDESFLSASRRLEHQKRKHFEPAYKCSLCSAKFVSSFELQKHLRRHFNPNSKLYVTESDNINVPTKLIINFNLE